MLERLGARRVRAPRKRWWRGRSGSKIVNFDVIFGESSRTTDTLVHNVSRLKLALGRLDEDSAKIEEARGWAEKAVSILGGHGYVYLYAQSVVTLAEIDRELILYKPKNAELGEKDGMEAIGTLSEYGTCWKERIEKSMNDIK
jgi:hypothetical protein